MNVNKPFILIMALVLTFLLGLASNAFSGEDKRVLVKMPERMREHQLSNMRDHLKSINAILMAMGNGELDKAADIAEARLGMSSLGLHGASHMAKLMPDEMKKIGFSMHHAASRFALKEQEGEPLPAYKALQDVTAACVACHAGFRTR